MSGGEFTFIAVVIAMGFAIGFASRQWWSLAVLALPSVVLLAATLPEWNEGYDTTGEGWFLIGFLFVGLPLLVGGVAGVLVGRLTLRSRTER